DGHCTLGNPTARGSAALPGIEGGQLASAHAKALRGSASMANVDFFFSWGAQLASPRFLNKGAMNQAVVDSAFSRGAVDSALPNLGKGWVASSALDQVFSKTPGYGTQGPWAFHLGWEVVMHGVHDTPSSEWTGEGFDGGGGYKPYSGTGDSTSADPDNN